MLRKILVITLMIGAVAGIVSLGAALFGDTASVPTNTFTSGTVIISTDPVTTLFTASNIAPGDVSYTPITVTNSGTLELRYDLTSIATDPGDDDLAGELELTIADDIGIGACDAAGFATHGTVIYSTGVLGNIDGVSATVLDSDRVIVATANEVLCFKIELPSTTPDIYQGATTVATFTFTAEQTANNP